MPFFGGFMNNDSSKGASQQRPYQGYRPGGQTYAGNTGYGTPYQERMQPQSVGLPYQPQQQQQAQPQQPMPYMPQQGAVAQGWQGRQAEMPMPAQMPAAAPGAPYSPFGMGGGMMGHFAPQGAAQGQRWAQGGAPWAYGGAMMPFQRRWGGY